MTSPFPIAPTRAQRPSSDRHGSCQRQVRRMPRNLSYPLFKPCRKRIRPILTQTSFCLRRTQKGEKNSPSS
ncbi:hypothetical protein ARMGADRAFT_429493 [Armillaria gallica]|uniref:Uncharacterized protein n=1 Tax=Armillaria gallica TaxID=47427 RepID=A0A2H3CZ36_ARMGA|nr:hypothetical protein ARMGADRAFT_429493 [Armillaria gallica]